MHLLTDPWIPTDAGALTLPDALTPGVRLAAGEPREHAALLRLAALVHASGGAGALARDAGAFELFGARPFMQVPPELSAELPEVGLAAIDLTRASGDESTRFGNAPFGREFDDAPARLTPAQAALTLLTYQQWAPSRGRSRWGYTSDAPLARRAVFLAEGPDLAGSAALNAPEGPVTPFWRQALDWSAWRQARPQPLDAASALAYPWWGLTLKPGRHVSWVRIASGPKGTGAADPHVWQNAAGPRGLLLYAKSPAERSAEALLVDALLAALRGDPGAPLGFRRARAGGAQRVRCAVQVSRSGQPVLLGRLEASLPWPADPDGAAGQLATAADWGARLTQALRLAHLPLYPRGAREAAGASGAVHGYWSEVWPDLSAGLAAGSDPGDFGEMCAEAAGTALRAVTAAFPAHAAGQSGRQLGAGALRPAAEP